MKHQVSLPANALPSLAKHNLPFSKKLTLPPQGDCSFSNKGLQGASSEPNQATDEGGKQPLALSQESLPTCEPQKSRLAGAADMGMGAERQTR